MTLPVMAGEWFVFEVESAPLTPLQLRIAKTKGEPARQAPPISLRGQLFRPKGEGLFPAVVLLHGCRGPQTFQENWAEQLAQWGYVALLVDSFNGVKDICTKLNDIEARQIMGGRTADAYGALSYLTTLPYVDKHRIGVMGWAYSAVLGTVIEDGAQQFFKRKFKAAVSFYPDCGFTATGRFIAPVLVLIGEQDDWTPARICQKMAERSANSSYPPLVQVYPQAQHSFDDPAVGKQQILTDARNLYKNPALGATLGYDSEAHQDALQQVKVFLDQQLRFRPLTVTLDDLPVVVSETQMQNSVWAVSPNDPGPNMPPVGRSTFDYLFTRLDAGRRVYDIPVPFSALIQRIEQQLAVTETGVSPLKKVLIPQGRSLQRDAAAPDYFNYPRAVLAVDTEPVIHHGVAALLLKDRLFVAYVKRLTFWRLSVITRKRPGSSFNW